MKVFYSFDSINWPRVSVAVASVTAFWLGLISIIPERYHHIGMVILAAITSALLVLIRGGRPSVSEAVKDAVVDKLEKLPEKPELPESDFGSSHRSPFDK